ncbi:MAG: ribosome recycling factor [Clostridia bacterium]|nr:ribosome recycling factor [Clostridia bacterium]
MTMYRAVIDNAKSRMEKTKDIYQRDMLSLRAGRANPQILDRITVDYYGTATPLKQMGNINSPEPRLLTISLWDPKAIPLVEKAIQKSDLGMNPSNDGKVIRLVVPELNEERRKELTKVVRKSAEEAKVAMRNTRRDAMEQIKKLKKDSQITEDDQRKAEEELQKMTDGQIKDVDKIAAEKEKEIMEV